LSKEIGDVGLGLEIGSELERMFENDITPEARLGVFEAGVARADGAGVSVRARGGSTVDADWLEWVLGMARCLKLGDVTVRLPADGLIDPAGGAG